VKLNLGSGAHRLAGFENLDLPDWRFEDGLPYPDASVEGITISHALMQVALNDWTFVFSEIARVLEPGGVVRVTEDSTADPNSERFGGFPGAVTLTSRALVGKHMQQAGLHVSRSKNTKFRDESLVQEHHGVSPKVFHIEGVKP
jgi:ubiquinone/menaquinone biosynthesis C-methylase UbiE